MKSSLGNGFSFEERLKKTDGCGFKLGKFWVGGFSRIFDFNPEFREIIFVTNYGIDIIQQ